LLFLEPKNVRFPALGLGTWELRGRQCARIVEQAVRLGYRHFDTAQMYGNERDVGDGIRASGIKRDEVFVVTKVAPDNLAPTLLVRSVKESVGALRLGEIDLLLLHWPNKGLPLAETIDALVSVKRDGFVRNIGVSNYTVALIEEASRLSGERLVCNQFEYHPYLDQSKVLAYCRKMGLIFTAYCPLARGRMFSDPVLTEIARAHGKTIAQIALRWLVQQGDIAPIPRSSNPERIAQNLDIFGFSLSAEEMKKIGALKRPDGRIANPAGRAPAWD
jgi:2,5-diketo-D-gluconate reductase B